MFPLSPNSCKDEKDGLSMCSLTCQNSVPGLESLLFICLREREKLGDSEERMCFYNNTRLTALKLKSSFNFLGSVQGATKGAPVLPAGAGQ